MKISGIAGTALRALFILTLIWGVSIFWIAPRPPLIDLPQHAAQVALMHDLATGESPWADIFTVNLVTPYLIGYGLAFPLSFIFPIAVAMKIILSGAYVAFVLLGCRLRAHFRADARLDWLLFPAFFGFAYTWGFYTFLVSTPVLFVFLLAVDRYAQAPTLRGGILATLAGLGLLLSHGLAFAFGMIVAGCLYTVRSRDHVRSWAMPWMRNAWPLLVPGMACVALYIASIRYQAKYWVHGYIPLTWEGGIMRVPRLIMNAVGDYYNPDAMLSMMGLLLLAAPWLLGLRINRREPAVWVLLTIVVFVELFVPHTMMSTAYFYQRYAVFFLPAYALIFGASSPAPRERAENVAVAPVSWHRRAAGSTVLVGCVWGVLGFHTLEVWNFAQEAKDFEPILSAMEPGQRVLSLAYSIKSDAAGLSMAYRHYATWYGAERHGLVDFSFAWFPPQIVRFRPARLPLVKEGFRPEHFDPNIYPLDTYRYVIARHTQALRPDLFKDASCASKKLAENGTWTLFEVLDCPSARHRKEFTGE